MQIKTACPTGCKYISGGRCIASECPYSYCGIQYDIKMNTFPQTTKTCELDKFISWLRSEEQHGTVLPMSVDDIANAVELYKEVKGVKSQKPIDTIHSM